MIDGVDVKDHEMKGSERKSKYIFNAGYLIQCQAWGMTCEQQGIATGM